MLTKSSLIINVRVVAEFVKTAKIAQPTYVFLGDLSRAATTLLAKAPGIIIPGNRESNFDQESTGNFFFCRSKNSRCNLPGIHREIIIRGNREFLNDQETTRNF